MTPALYLFPSLMSSLSSEKYERIGTSAMLLIVSMKGSRCHDHIFSTMKRHDLDTLMTSLEGNPSHIYIFYQFFFFF